MQLSQKGHYDVMPINVIRARVFGSYQYAALSWFKAHRAGQSIGVKHVELSVWQHKLGFRCNLQKMQETWIKDPVRDFGSRPRSDLQTGRGIPSKSIPR